MRVERGRPAVEVAKPAGRDRRRIPSPPRGRLARALLMSFALLGGCDYFDVVNPGPVDDRYLDDRSAHMGLVNGAGLALSIALNNVAFTTGAITREIFPGGSTGTFGITVQQQQGLLRYDDSHTGWLPHQQARAVAEQGFERFARTIAPESVDYYEPAGKIALWAGFAYRLLGENWCEITVDGGPAFPWYEALARAESWFSRALAIGLNVGDATIVNAARAGRASVRVGLGNWGGAVADAEAVPATFVFGMAYNQLSRDQGNRIYWAGSNSPFRSYTVWRTPYEGYYQETNDPRVAWVDTGLTGDAAVMDLGRVPFFRQLKYPDADSPIRLASGREMRLVVAEARLRDRDAPGALAIINQLRADVDVAPVDAATLDDAWALLKRERGIELWLEGRRMFDLRRWQVEGAPGALHTLEVPGYASRLSSERSLCYAIPLSERQTNVNLPPIP
jgi:hypothetical protein